MAYTLPSDLQTDKHNRQTDRQTDRRTDRRTDRQTDLKEVELRVGMCGEWEHVEHAWCVPGLTNIINSVIPLAIVAW